MNYQLLHQITSLPTAPFAEQRVIAFAEKFAQFRKRLHLSRDRFGNVLLELPGTKATPKSPRLVFTAHMDHPGFVAEKMLDSRTLRARFHGYVHIDYVRNTTARFFTPSGDEIPAKVISVEADEHDRMAVPLFANLRVSQNVPHGSPGMFDQGPGRIKGKKFLSRACDDLAGLAAALTMLDALHKKPPAATVAVLLTRAEEEGFIGAIAASLNPKLLRKSDRIIAIETSMEQPYAQQSHGTIIRIGDRSSVFNSDLSYFITHTAEKLAAADPDFKWQRALMPGGTCEATVYDIYGFIAASICIPLGNYHNMDRAKKKIAPEYIDLADWTNMVKLFETVARQAHTYAPGHKLLKAKVEARFNRFKKYL